MGDDKVIGTLDRTKPITFELKNVNADGLMKMALGQGYYNAMVLRRDGYLNEKNGWIKGGK